MEIHTATAVKASSSSDEEEQINFIKRKTDKLSITENPYEEIERQEYEYDQFINKAKKEINHFTQLIREFLKGSLNIESIAPFDVEILDIHWNRISSRDVIDTNDAVTYISIDIDESMGRDGTGFQLNSTCTALLKPQKAAGNGILRCTRFLDLVTFEETKLEVALDDFIGKSIRPVERIIMSDEYPSLHDDLKALLREQYNWQMLDLDISSGSDSDSEDKGMMVD